MNIFFASSNRHKKIEMSEIFSPHTIILPSDKNINCNPEETGSTFFENSMIKAKALWDIVHEPVLADDSGICIDLLDGRPGIHSARYTGLSGNTTSAEGRKLSDMERNFLLLDEIDAVFSQKKLNPAERSKLPCRFVCCMIFYYGNEKFYAVQETIEGLIVASREQIAGSGGFGYDPLVYLPEFGRTVAQLTPEEKNRISHRGKAGAAIRSIISS